MFDLKVFIAYPLMKVSSGFKIYVEVPKVFRVIFSEVNQVYYSYGMINFASFSFV